MLETPIGDAQNAEACELQGRIADPVTLERCSRAMELVPVELDHQPLVVPHGIDLVAGDEDVDRGSWQPNLAAECEEPPLELGAGRRRLSIGLECRTQQGPSGTSSTTCLQALYLPEVEETQSLSLLYGVLQLVRRDHGREIQKRPGDRCHWDAVA